MRCNRIKSHQKLSRNGTVCRQDGQDIDGCSQEAWDSSTNAASVVDFPDPVGPPIKTSPNGRLVSCATFGGKPNPESRGGRAGNALIAASGRMDEAMRDYADRKKV